ncbi:AraC family transcriptional regulator [Paenibacillus taihuensis]|uniref:AraC family transcriptional regulator n=1 Tax=Paenibacillus taihuensis TaxID=1156355 RepID=A0A3D9S7B0_9BACL|nr:AraC family transcriptional regulator [Paenibacillus taihuensis]REE85166.1 AraC family transcriptional regulator [Paenibacillus taihuensis]
MAYINIPYQLAETQFPPPCQFKSIWKVEANNSYQAVHPQGLISPGLFVTLEGRGKFVQDGKETILAAGTLFFVRERIPCSYDCVDDNWKFYFIHFDQLPMIEHLGLPIGERITSTKINEAVRLCERLIEILILKSIGHEYAAHLLLQELLLLFAGDQIIKLGSSLDLEEILLHMHRAIDQPFRSEDFIRHSGLSRTAFFSQFREMTGKSPNQYMLELKLASAKVSLESTSTSVKDIAAALHFYDEFHLSKSFKKRYGVSPRSYRKMHS